MGNCILSLKVHHQRNDRGFDRWIAMMEAMKSMKITRWVPQSSRKLRFCIDANRGRSLLRLHMHWCYFSSAEWCIEEPPYREHAYKTCGQLYERTPWATRRVKRAGDILKKPDEFESVRLTDFISTAGTPVDAPCLHGRWLFFGWLLVA